MILKLCQTMVLRSLVRFAMVDRPRANIDIANDHDLPPRLDERRDPRLEYGIEGVLEFESGVVRLVRTVEIEEDEKAQIEDCRSALLIDIAELDGRIF